MSDGRAQLTPLAAGAVALALVVSVMAGAGFALTGSTDDGNLNQVNNQEPTGPAISFIAFCSVNGVSESDVTITNVDEDQDGEVVSVSYTVSGDLDSIVTKAGQDTRLINDPANPGTVEKGQGTLQTDDTPPNGEFASNSPCPDGQTGVKYSDYDDQTGEFAQVESVS